MRAGSVITATAQELLNIQPIANPDLALADSLGILILRQILLTL